MVISDRTRGNSREPCQGGFSRVLGRGAFLQRVNQALNRLPEQGGIVGVPRTGVGPRWLSSPLELSPLRFHAGALAGLGPPGAAGLLRALFRVLQPREDALPPQMPAGQRCLPVRGAQPVLRGGILPGTPAELAALQGQGAAPAQEIPAPLPETQEQVL